MATVLIELVGGEGIVRGDDGEIMLTHDVTLDWGQPNQPHDRYQPIRIGLSDERTLFGGLLPPGAVSVEAVEATGVRKAATVGGGTYAVISEDGEHSDPALGYRDAGGAFVHRPMPAEPASAGHRCRGTLPCVRGGPVRGVLPDRGVARRSRP